MKFVISLSTFIVISILAQGNTLTDTTKKIKTEDEIKTNWTFSAIPALAYDTDVGFLYGGVVNFFYYGDGTSYPKYWHSIYLEISRSTKGTGTNQLKFDSDSLFRKFRTFIEFSYLTEKLFDFYGYNGYEAFYNPSYEDMSSDDYISRMFYRQERKLFRLRGDVIKKISDSHFKWFAGFEYYNIQLDTIDLDKVNKGKKESELVPSSEGGLYGLYKKWGLLPQDQFNGGIANIVKCGLMYDTRDNEPNPNRGIWTEFQLVFAPEFFGNDYSFSKFIFIHRQYLTLYPKKLTFDYRLSYQSKLSGTIPSFMLPFIYNSVPSLTKDGLGGARSLRGVKRNRVVGEDYFFGNFELRWKLYKTVVLKQNFYISLNFFFDSGLVLKKYDLQNTNDEDAISYLNNGGKETFHNSLGTGIRFAHNDNFIVGGDYGFALDKYDGGQGFYIVLNYLF